VNGIKGNEEVHRIDVVIMSEVLREGISRGAGGS
jgi:hypothetical protein